MNKFLLVLAVLLLSFCWNGYSQTSEEFNIQGDYKFNENNYMGAIADYNKAIRIDPKYIKAHLRRINLKSQLKDWKGCVAYCTKAIKIDSIAGQVYTIRGNSKGSMCNYDGAIKDYTESINLNSQDYWAYSFRGMTKKCAGDAIGAEIDSKRADELRPITVNNIYNNYT